MAGLSDAISFNTEDNEKREGLHYFEDSLTLDLDDVDIQRIIGDRIQTAESFWNNELELDRKVKLNEKYWLNTQLNEEELYDFQVPYKNNRIFTSIEQLIPTLLSNPPQPLIIPAQDTDASRQNAEELEKVLLAQYEDLYLKSELMMVVRHLLIGYRRGVMKYKWDTTKGRLLDDGSRKGDISVATLRPQRVVFEKNAKLKDDIPLIAEYQLDSVEELMFKFPSSKDEIWRATGVGKNFKSPSDHLASPAGYVECWFTYYMDNGEKCEGLAWKMDQVVLDKMKNPNWNYDESKKDDKGQLEYVNFFDRPQKPYILFNYLNLGRFIVDETSLTEQAAPLQDTLNKRGRQIVENSDQASSGTVFNSDMISSETVSQLTGNPAEKALVKGDVRMAAMRLPTSQLEPYVLEDKQDARNEIDNVFGTRDPLRDNNNNVKTVGQTVVTQRQDIGRMQTLATAIEDGSDRLYKGIVQMMKVFYDEETLRKYTGPDGQIDFINFNRDKIEDGIAVRVKTGSVLPDDPGNKQQMGQQMAAVLDPLSLGMLLSGQDPFQNPKEFAKNMFLFRSAPDKYYEEVLGQSPDGEIDAQAAGEIQQMNQGIPQDPQESPSKSHLAQHEAYVQSPMFQQASPQVQQLHIVHIRGEIANAKRELGMENSTKATDKESEDRPTDKIKNDNTTEKQPNFLQRAMKYMSNSTSDTRT